jgi:hypothetical protein
LPFNLSFATAFEWLLHDTNKFTKTAEELAETEAPAADADRVDEEVDKRPIRHAEGDKDTSVCLE